MAASLRQPVLVVLIALPVATLLAGGLTLALIGRDGLDTVGDPVKRTAQVQQVDLSADEAALALGHAANLELAADIARLTWDGAPPLALPDTLMLRLEHPLQARLDRTVALSRRGAGWQGPWPEGVTAWKLALSPEDRSWRIVGRREKGAIAVRLQPALATTPGSTPNPADGHDPH